MRIGLRDNLLLPYVAAVVSVFVVAASGRTAALLVIPPIGFVGLHIYLSNDARVDDIRNFLRTSLPPSAAREWEAHSRRRDEGRNYLARSVVRRSSQSVIFAGPSILASIMLLESNKPPVALLSLVLVFSTVLYALTAIAYWSR